MIGYLKGEIFKKLEKSIILKIGNIGYSVLTTSTTLQNITEKEEIELFIYTKVREDDISLYGFETIEELNFFKIIISVNGVGPKLAIEILGQKLNKVKNAILNKDVSFLSKIPGIGKKKAERLILELKNKIDPISLIEKQETVEEEINIDAEVALTSLGYNRYEINRVLKKMPENIKDTEEIIRYFLQNV